MTLAVAEALTPNTPNQTIDKVDSDRATPQLILSHALQVIYMKL